MDVKPKRNWMHVVPYTDTRTCLVSGPRLYKKPHRGGRYICFVLRADDRDMYASSLRLYSWVFNQDYATIGPCPSRCSLTSHPDASPASVFHKDNYKLYDLAATSAVLPPQPPTGLII